MSTQLRDAGFPAESSKVVVIDRRHMIRHFGAHGLVHVSHHSGWGGYAKLILPELLPADVETTIMLDADTVVARDLAPLWSLRHRLASSGHVLAAKRLSTGGVCLRGQRINSGVMLLSIRRMRELNWTSSLLANISHLGRRGAPARECGKMVRGNGSTLAAGDQELLSLGCLLSGACSALPPRLHQDTCDGFSGSDALVYHFNCRGRPESCPSARCRELVKLWARLKNSRHRRRNL